MSPRQVEVLRLVEKGMTNKAIALALKLKKRTIDAYMENILKKLEAKNRTQACSIAREKGWLKEKGLY